MSKATSRSLVVEASIVRSDSLVNAGAVSGEPGCSIWAPAESCERGELTIAKSAISRRLFLFCAIDWVTSVVSARGLRGSTCLGGIGAAGERPRVPRRVGLTRRLVAPPADEALPAIERAPRLSDSRIKIPSSAPGTTRAGAGRGAVDASLQRAGTVRSAGAGDIRSGFTKVRAGASASARPRGGCSSRSFR